jgi:gamma-glutamylcyclotransferase (GGCT)/AIG2-like uncharacterized protein YtfP
MATNWDFLDKIVEGPVRVPTVQAPPVDLNFQAPLTAPRPRVDVPPPQLYRGPTGFTPTFRPNFGGASSLSSVFRPTAAVTPQPSFPERLSIDLSGFWNEVTQLSRGLETLSAPLKLVGNNAIGTGIANFGQSPAGQLIQNFVNSVVVEPVAAAGRLFTAPFTEDPSAHGAKNIFMAADPWEQLKKNIDAYKGPLGDFAEVVAALGAFKLLKAAPLLKDTVVPFFKGAGEGLTGGGKAILQGNFSSWLTAPIRGGGSEVLRGDVAENLGKMAGRIFTGASFAGYAEAKAIDAIAPDSWASRELAHNLWVPEGSKSRLALDVVESLPLDLAGLGGIAKSLGGKARLGRLGGAANADILDEIFPSLDWRAAAANIPGAAGTLDWIVKKSSRDAAQWSLLDNLNISVADAGQNFQFVHANQLGFANQETLDKAILDEMNRILQDEGTVAMRQRQYDVIMGKGDVGSAGYRPGWPQFKNMDTETGKLINAVDFYTAAKDSQRVFGDALHPIVDYQGIGRQSVDAWHFLDGLADGEWTAVTKDLFIHNFPAINKVFEDSYATTRKGIRNMGRDELKSWMQSVNFTEEQWTMVPDMIGYQLAKLATGYEKILAAGKKVTPEMLAEQKATLAEIDKLRAPYTTELAKKIEAIQSAIEARRVELSTIEGEDAAWAPADAEIQRLEELLHTENRRFFEASSAGTRYSIGKFPKGNVMKLFDEAADGKPIDFAGRNRGGQIWDSLFGGISNRREGFETFQRVTNIMDEAGITPVQRNTFYDAMRVRVEDWSKRNILGRPFSLHAALTVYNLPSWVVNKIARDVNLGAAPKGFKSWHEVLYRAKYGPLKLASERVFGKSIDVPYNAYVVNAHRFLYPLVRFTLSPRFIMMNLFEGDFFKAFMAGRAKLTPEQQERLISIAAQITGAKFDAKLGKWVYSGGAEGDILTSLTYDLSNLVDLAKSERADRVNNMLVDAIHNHPAAQDWIKERGLKTRQDVLLEVEKTMAEREKVIAGFSAENPAEAALVKRQKDLERSLRTPLGRDDEITTRAEIAANQRELDNLYSDRKVKAEAAKLQMNDPRMTPLIDAVISGERQSLQWSREILHGNQSRSAFERAANSFLLYWPVSYQLKAGKAMMDFMLRKGFGVRTNAAPAVFIREAERWIQDNQDDPEVSDFFKKNRQTLFLMQGMFPSTPNEVGVSLSPVFRIPIQVLKGPDQPGGKTVAQGFDRLTAIGIINDKTLFQQLITEQSKKGGFLHDIVVKAFGDTSD